MEFSNNFYYQNGRFNLINNDTFQELKKFLKKYRQSV